MLFFVKLRTFSFARAKKDGLYIEQTEKFARNTLGGTKGI